MKLHFDFNLVRFRYNRIYIGSEVEATVFCFLGDREFEKPAFKLYGDEKISAFSREIISKLNSEKPDILVLRSGPITPFAVSLVPYNCPEDVQSINMNALDYLLIHSGTKHMNGLMNLETLNSYMDYWMDKFGPSPLD